MAHTTLVVRHSQNNATANLLMSDAEFGKIVGQLFSDALEAYAKRRIQWHVAATWAAGLVFCAQFWFCSPGHAQAQTVCGFPGYACARNDYATHPVSSMGTVPPDAGPNKCVAGADGHLQSCGNIYGLNKQFVEPDYKNAKIVRVTDYEDIKSGCVPVSGLGGAAGHNVFSRDSQYLVIGCTEGWVRIKWFNPATMQINTSPRNPAGYVLTSAGKIWSGPQQSRFGYTRPGAVYNLVGTQVSTYTITKGVISDTATPVADYVNAIPCWSAACPDWVHGSYSAGANIIPKTNNATPAHSFQLINGPCTTGNKYPNFLSATAETPAATQYVITDGTCQWADMWIPPASGGQITWSAGLTLDKTDKIISAIMSNHKGQDASGACFVGVYDGKTNTYSHLNICTGNVYNDLAYVGNVYDDNTFPHGRHNRVVLHSSDGFSSGWGATLAFNNCAFADLTGRPIYCEASLPGNKAASFNAYFWQFGTSHMLNAKDWLGTGTPGHAFPGFGIFGYSDMLNSQPYLYQGRVIGSAGPDIPYWDISKRTCTPDDCFANDVRGFDFDQHGSWVSNDGTDKTPICQASYGAAGGNGQSVWPPQYPWLGEVECMATDGSNVVSRQAYTYDTQTSIYFNLQFQIGSLSSDGNWWIFSTDWFCTLGNQNGAPSTVCGLPYQMNHDYSVVGELMGPVQYYSGVPGRIYKVMTPGKTDGNALPASYWCNTPGCQIREGTAVFQYVGQNDSQPAVFMVKLQ